MKIKTHEDLEVYQIAFKAAMEIFELSKKFPSEEKYSLTDPSGSPLLMGETPKTALSHQIRRSSRSVCANLAEAWRKRRYKAASLGARSLAPYVDAGSHRFIAKLSDSEAALKDTASHKAAEVQVWLKFAVECGYLEVDIARNLYKSYNRILGSLVNMMNNPDKWIL